MILKNIIVVSSEDGEWQGIYLQEGEMYTLWGESYSLNNGHWIELINHHHLNNVSQQEVSYHWMNQEGNFPNNYEDIPQEAFV